MPIKRNTRTYKTSGRRTSKRRTTGSFGGSRATKTTRNSSKTWKPTTAYAPSKFGQTRKQLTAKIASFRTINQQVSGTGKVTAFSPTNANKWIKFVNTGANVYKFSGAQWSRHFGKLFNSTSGAVSPSIAMKALKKQFGTGIKAVTKGKGNNWLVAATPSVHASPFKNYSFK